MKKVRISVSKKDIREGKRNSACDCMVARAIGRHLKSGSRVSVSDVDVLIVGVDGYFPFPGRVTPLIHAFDCGRPVGPFWFELELPEEVLR